MLTTYSPRDVVVTLAGIHSVTGYAEGEFIRIVKDIKPFIKHGSMDGEIARVYNKDQGWRVELTIMQSSPTNDILSMLYNVDIATRMGKFPLMIKDTKGSTSFLALTAWVEDLPRVSFSGQLETRTWILGCSEVAMNIGGNVDQSLVEQAILLGSSLLPALTQFGGF